MNQNMLVFLVNTATELVQINIHGSRYSCPLKMKNGQYFFAFKNNWYKLDDYIDEFTRYIR